MELICSICPCSGSSRKRRRRSCLPVRLPSCGVRVPRGCHARWGRICRRRGKRAGRWGGNHRQRLRHGRQASSHRPRHVEPGHRRYAAPQRRRRHREDRRQEREGKVVTGIKIQILSWVVCKAKFQGYTTQHFRRARSTGQCHDIIKTTMVCRDTDLYSVLGEWLPRLQTWKSHSADNRNPEIISTCRRKWTGNK